MSMDEIRIENLLADALKPVDPPQRMSDRLHDTPRTAPAEER